MLGYCMSWRCWGCCRGWDGEEMDEEDVGLCAVA